MFYYLNGHAKPVDSQSVVMDVGGVGYLLNVSSYTMGDVMNSQKEGITLYTYMAIREDAVELYGFSQEIELDTFRLLINVSGIGPKAALSILSTMTPSGLSSAIIAEDKKAISNAPGVGAKTAARVILELKDKITKVAPLEEGEDIVSDNSAVTNGNSHAVSDVENSLASLGYTKSEISSVMSHIDKNGDVESMIKQALKYLMR